MTDYIYLMEDSVPFWFYNIAEIQYLYARRLLKDYGVTPEQLSALCELGGNCGMRQKDLSKRIYKDQANTTRILKRLDDKGLVDIRPSLADKRVKVVTLSDKGSALLDEVVPVVVNKAEIFKDIFTQEEIGVLKDMLSRYYEVLNADLNKHADCK